MLLQTTYQSPLGKIILLARADQLVGLWFAGQKYQGSQYDLNQVTSGKNQILQQTQNWLDAYFSSHNPAIAQLNLAPEVTPFRQQVLAVLTQIPQGQVLTYGEIAKKTQHGKSALSFATSSWWGSWSQSHFDYYSLSSRCR